MNLKTLFSKSIIKSDFKRYWWVSALYGIMLAFAYTFVILSDVVDCVSLNHKEDLYIYTDDGTVIILGFIVPVVLGVVLFSYLQKGKNVTFFHSLPLTRKTLFFSHLYSGLVMFILPLLINFIASFAILEGFGVTKHLSQPDIYECIYSSFIYGTLLFCLSSLVSSFMGNSVASFLFTYVFYFLAVAAEGFIEGMAGELLYGFDNVILQPYSMKMYFFDNPGSISHLIAYAVFSVILLVAGYFVYKKRHLENHSEVVAFPKLKIVFIMGCGIAFGAIGYLYFLGMFDTKSVFSFIPFGIIGIIISGMISAKSFRVPKIYKPIIAFLCLVLVFFAIFDLDILGYESYVPQADDVESVTFEHSDRFKDNYIQTYGYIDERRYEFDEVYQPVSTNPETIKKVCAFHEKLIRLRDKYHDSVKITYKLKNGKKVSRYYEFDPYKFERELKGIFESDLRTWYLPVLNEEKRDYYTLSIINKNTTECLITLNGSDAINEIITELKKDLQDMPYEEYSDYQAKAAYRIEFSYQKPAHFSDGTVAEDAHILSEEYEVYESYENILKVIGKYVGNN